MADQLPNSHYYKALQGIDQKSSAYEMSTAKFLKLYNLDFDIPNALSKRPGSSLFSANFLSGTIHSLFEFRTTPAILNIVPSDFFIAADDSGIWYSEPNAAMNSNTFSLMLGGIDNTGQPPDFLNYNQVLYAANGQYWKRADAGLSMFSAGLLQSAVGLTNSRQFSVLASGVSYYLVAGLTHFPGYSSGPSPVSNFQQVNVGAAYSYIRYDGYEGPLNVIQQSDNLMASVMKGPTFGVQNNATDLLLEASSGGAGGFLIQGFTAPSGIGITALALYLDFNVTSTTLSPVPYGNGYAGGGASYGNGLKLLPSANVNFKFFTLLPTSTSTFTLTYGVLNSWSGFLATNPRGPSGMTFDWFNTNTPKYIEINQNQMFAAGMAQNRNTVWFSNVGSPEFFDPENTFNIITNDGDQIYGMKYFNEQLIIFKERSFHKLVGSDPNNFQLLQVSGDYGCISNRSIVTTDLNMLWLDRKGIVKYNGANFSIISNQVEGIFRRMNLDAAHENACGVHWVSRSQIWWGIPIDGSNINNITVVYDYLIDAWTFFDGFQPACFTYARCNLPQHSVWRGDYSGNVHFFGSSFFNDSGQAITCLAMTRFENEGGENQTTLWRRFFLDVQTNNSGVTGVINGRWFSNYDQSTVQGTFTVYQNQYQTRTEMGVQGKAIAAQFSHNSASLPLVVNGYGWAKRPLRNV